MKIYDITPPLTTGMAVWPGDVQFTYSQQMSIRDGDSTNLSSLSTSLHNGAHADAPSHFADDGLTIEKVDLETYCGAATLLNIEGVCELQPEMFEGRGLSPRLLIRTGAWSDRAKFPESIPTMHEDVPAYLASRGVRLLGLDLPSVDHLESKDLPIHHALYRNSIAILESLYLEGLEEGDYELIALPLPLQGADASPVRAILRK